MLILDSTIGADNLKAALEKRKVTMDSFTKIYYPYRLFYYKVIYVRKFLQPKTYPFIVAIESLTGYPFLLRKSPVLIEVDLEGKIVLDSIVPHEKAENLALKFVKDSVHLKGGINAIPNFELHKSVEFHKCNYLINGQFNNRKRNILMDGNTGCIGIIDKETLAST